MMFSITLHFFWAEHLDRVQLYRGAWQAQLQQEGQPCIGHLRCWRCNQFLLELLALELEALAAMPIAELVRAEELLDQDGLDALLGEVGMCLHSISQRYSPKPLKPKCTQLTIRDKVVAQSVVHSNLKGKVLIQKHLRVKS